MKVFNLFITLIIAVSILIPQPVYYIVHAQVAESQQDEIKAKTEDGNPEETETKEESTTEETETVEETTHETDTETESTEETEEEIRVLKLPRKLKAKKKLAV